MNCLNSLLVLFRKQGGGGGGGGGWRGYSLNPLSPNSDQHQISPCNINALLNRVVMRITDMITQDAFA